jgi:DNA modification methylase
MSTASLSPPATRAHLPRSPGPAPGLAPPGRLVLRDNLDALQATADSTIDLIYIDPPFATGATRRGRARLQYPDRERDPERFTEWLALRLSHCRRVLRPTGSLFVHLDHRTVHYVKVLLDRLFGRSLFVNEIIWAYSVGGKSRRSFGRKHDTILWYGRTPEYAFYPEAVRIPRRSKSHMRVARDEAGRPVQEKTDRKTGKVYRYPVADGKIPEDWWADIEVLNRGDRERTGWPTQKPERLLQRIVGATTQPGDLVADWFSGSGTTAAVCYQLGRRFIATDTSEEAMKTARDRLARRGLTLEIERPGPGSSLL